MKFKAHADTQQVTRRGVIIVLLIWPINAPKVHVISVFTIRKTLLILATKVQNITETDKQILKNNYITLAFLLFPSRTLYIL